MLVIYEADYISKYHISIQQLGKHCNNTACYQATSTQHIIPADKKVYIATYQPLKSTCVELKSVLTVLLAYPPLVTLGEKSLF